MGRDDVRFAVAAREDGLRRVRRLTFRIGAVGVASSAAIALAFSHLSGSAAASGTGSTSTGSTSTGAGGTGAGGTGSSGTGSSGTGSGQSGGTQDGTQPGGGSLQAPAQNVSPAQGPAQGVSGGS